MKIFSPYQRFKATLNRNKIKKSFYSWCFSTLIIVSTSSLPVQAQAIPGDYVFSCPVSNSNSNTGSSQSNSQLSIPQSWQSKFPFDLIYPIASSGYSADPCPTIDLWGVPRQVCSIGMLTATAKNVFLLKMVISSLLSL